MISFFTKRNPTTKLQIWQNKIHIPVNISNDGVTLTFDLLTLTSRAALGGLIECISATYAANLLNMQRAQQNFKLNIWPGPLDM